MWMLGLGDAAAAADEQNNKIIVLSSRGGASVISTSGGNAIQCAGLHHMHTAPGHTSAIHSGIS